MEGADVLIWARAAERLSITALAGLSLVLGWDLFRRGVVDAQTADLKMSNWSVRLQRVGPGCFFALFGTVVFVYSLSHPLSVSTPQSSTNTTTAAARPETFSYAGSAQLASDRETVTAINTYLRIVRPRGAKNLDAGESTAVDRATQVLESYKNAVLLQHFGAMATKYFELRDKAATTPAALAAETQDTQIKYAEIEGWDLDTFLKKR